MNALRWRPLAEMIGAEVPTILSTRRESLNDLMSCGRLSTTMRQLKANVTLHEKTMHNALTTDFELRPPLPTTTFELLILQI